MIKLKDMLFTFVCVTTCVVFASAIYITLFWQEAQLDVSILWQILIVSLLCSLGSLLYPKKIKTKRAMNLIIILHYIYINLVVLGCGFLFEWFYINDAGMVLGMLFTIAIIFVFMSILFYRTAKKQTQNLNDQLREYIDKRKHD